MNGVSGYRHRPAGGPSVRTDIVEVYIVRDAPDGHEFLQVRRATDPLRGTWHPVIGHIEAGESAAQAAFRELGEEVGLRRGDPALLEVFALEQVHPYYLAALDCIVMSPRFVARAARGWEPTLNDEHDAHRWVPGAAALDTTMWPGQKRAIEEIMNEVLRAGSLSRAALRLDAGL